jgi:FixJ family two-component response regulator
MTGHDGCRMEDEAVRYGAVAYLRKPFDDQRLLDAIQVACKKET